VPTSANNYCLSVLGVTITKSKDGSAAGGAPAVTTGAASNANGLPTAVLGRTVTNTAGAGSLPFTGLDTVGLLGLVGAMFGGGLVLFWAARTRSRRRV
jgi:uncharacterized membrane protein